MQGTDGLVSLNLAQSSDSGHSLPAAKARALSSARFALAPSNIALPDTNNPFQTTHFNRLRFPCQPMGEFSGLALGYGTVHAAWGDTCNSIGPPDNALDPITGWLHTKEYAFSTIPLDRALSRVPAQV
jgi:hypothetical protein